LLRHGQQPVAAARPTQLGRLIQEGEDRPGAELVVVLGHRIWQDRYHGDPNVLGRSARINGQTATVVGVMPDGLRFPVAEEIWVPLRLDSLELPRGEGTTLEVIGRLKPGVTPEQANAELAGIAHRLETAYPEANAGVGVNLKPYVSEFVGEEAIALLYTMLGAVFGVLLIACANVANLLLARATLRTREVAIRSALGASRGRVIAQHLAESSVLAVLGAGLGLGLAAIGARLFDDVLVAVAQGVPFWFDIGINPRVALFVVLLSGLASLLAGIFPAIQASSADFNAVLKDDSRGSSSLRLGRFSRVLVITEVALSCSLLVGAALMIKTVVQLDRFEPEFLTEEVFTARFGLFESDYPDVESRRRFYRELRQRLAGRPGVEGAAISTGLPGWGTGRDGFAVDGVGYASEKDHPRAGSVTVSPGFFDVYAIPVLEGRDFEPSDDADALQVAVVSQSFARQHLAGEPLGKRIRSGESPWRTVIGVVPDLTQLGNPDGRLDIRYEPIEQSDADFASISVRTEAPPLSLTTLVRDEVAALDANLPIYWVFTMQQQVDNQTWFYGLFGTLFVIFGGVALFLAAIGLYAVMAFSVSQRTQEIGVRIAIGAGTRDVILMVLRSGMAQLGIGLGIGLLGAAGFARALAFILFEVEPWDPGVFATIVGVLLATGLIATLLPARRAALIDPATSLRYE